MTVYQPYIGRYYEDFSIGDIYKHWPGRTISESDNTWFTLLTMNKHPVHFDHHFAKKQMFGKPLVNSGLTLAIVLGMSVADTSQNTIANLGWESIKLPKPVFIGDTIYAESEILEKRESKSRPDTGIVSFETRAYNQNNDLIMSYTRTILAKRQGYDDGKLPEFGTSQQV
ncbi:MAG: MaoC family dehydratase [Thermodesulfobacteriota bacterium]|nr:MaoC family dehydratase [Thermodesulfobacteriota bacterium]